MAPALVLLFVALWFVLRGDLFCLTLCYFVLVFFSPFSIAITSLGEERVNLSAFDTFVCPILVWFCRFPLPLVSRTELRFEIVALPGLFSYFFCLFAFPLGVIAKLCSVIIALPGQLLCHFPYICIRNQFYPCHEKVKGQPRINKADSLYQKYK